MYESNSTAGAVQVEANLQEQLGYRVEIIRGYRSERRTEVPTTSKDRQEMMTYPEYVYGDDTTATKENLTGDHPGIAPDLRSVSSTSRSFLSETVKPPTDYPRSTLDGRRPVQSAERGDAM